MNFLELETQVIQWANERYIFSSEHGSSAERQCAKLDEEFQELCKAVLHNDLKGIVDGLGDMLVVMILIARFKNMDLTTCLNYAYNEIKDRKGRMINGLFVKE